MSDLRIKPNTDNGDMPIVVVPMSEVKEREQNGTLTLTANLLFRFDDIQNTLVELDQGHLISDLFDKLTGFPNGEDKTVGELKQFCGQGNKNKQYSHNS